MPEFTVRYGPDSPVHLDATTISDLSFHPYKDTAIVVGRATWEGTRIHSKADQEHAHVRAASRAVAFGECTANPDPMTVTIKA